MIVLIPAKGCSTRIPRKNLQHLTADDTLLSWSIRNWRQILPGARIVVATEDDEIRMLACSLGCDVHDETPEQLANQARTATELLIEFAATTEQRPIILSQCTSPFTFKRDVMAALSRPLPMVRSGFLSIVHRSDNQTRLSQDIEPEAAATGNFIITNGYPDLVRDWICRESLAEVDQVSAIDINTPEDLRLARWLAARITLRDLCN